ncbi:MAG: YtxH domain-containing protein [Weeksellaceae bacterium]
MTNNTHDNKSSKLGLAVAVGAIAGGLAAFFLSPKSGKENREMAKVKFDELKRMVEEKKLQGVMKEIYGTATAEGTRLYKTAMTDVQGRLTEIQDSVGEIDQEKYMALVLDVVEKLKTEKDATQDRVSRLQDYLLGRWDDMQMMVEKDAKKTGKDVKKTLTEKPALESKKVKKS